MFKFKKIRRDVAKRLFEAGEAIYTLPNKLRVDNLWMSPFCISADSDTSFDSVCNAISYYNCNSECGKTLAFYLKEEM